MDCALPEPSCAPPEWPVFPTDLTRRARSGFVQPSSAIGRLSRFWRPDQFSTAMAAALAGTRVEKVRGGSALSLLRSSGSKLRNFTLALSDGRTVEVVLKCPAEELKTEISFYCELAPRLKIRVPRLLGILKDHSQGSWMILEALDPGVGHASLSKNDLKEAIRTLAGLHAQ